MVIIAFLSRVVKIRVAKCLLVFLCVASMLSFISYVKFSTLNFPKVAMSLSSITFGKKSCIEIKTKPRVILATPKNSEKAFEYFLSIEGYTIVDDEQLGSLYVIEKNGKKEHVHLSVNGFYSKWVWS